MRPMRLQAPLLWVGMALVLGSGCGSGATDQHPGTGSAGQTGRGWTAGGGTDGTNSAGAGAIGTGQSMAAPGIVLAAAREVAAAPAASLAPPEAQAAASTAKTAAIPTQIARSVTRRRARLLSAPSGATASIIACSDGHPPSSPVPRAPPCPAVSRTPTVRRCLTGTAFLSGEVLAAARRRCPRTCALTTPVRRTRIARRAPAFAPPDILASASPDPAERTTTALPALLESAFWTQSVP
jgi:hypothetical protein